MITPEDLATLSRLKTEAPPIDPPAASERQATALEQEVARLRAALSAARSGRADCIDDDGTPFAGARYWRAANSEAAKRLEEARELMLKRPSEICRSLHIQACHLCDDLDCCDNTSEIKQRIAALEKELDEARAALETARNEVIHPLLRAYAEACAEYWPMYPASWVFDALGCAGHAWESAGCPLTTTTTTCASEPACACPWMPAPGFTDLYGPLQCETHGLDCPAGECRDTLVDWAIKEIRARAQSPVEPPDDCHGTEPPADNDCDGEVSDG